MNRLREKTTATLLIAIFMISAFAIVMPVSADPPTINGMIGSGEWDGALSMRARPHSIGSRPLVAECLLVT